MYTGHEIFKRVGTYKLSSILFENSTSQDCESSENDNTITILRFAFVFHTLCIYFRVGVYK